MSGLGASRHGEGMRGHLAAESLQAHSRRDGWRRGGVRLQGVRRREGARAVRGDASGWHDEPGGRDGRLPVSGPPSLREIKLFDAK